MRLFTGNLWLALALTSAVQAHRGVALAQIGTYDSGGRVVAVDERSGPVRVAGGTNADAVEPDPDVQEQVVEPVAAAVAALAANVIGVSEVVLDGRLVAVRTQETNQGNLIADALLWQARKLAASFGVAAPDVALHNGGGIRNNSEVPVGDISKLMTFNMLPLADFLTVVEDISPAQFKEILENAVSQVENTAGRFAQIAGFTLVYDPEGTAQVLDKDGQVITPGTRVVSAVLDNGREIVAHGRAVGSAQPVTIATIDFLSQGGDQYPYRLPPSSCWGPASGRWPTISPTGSTAG